MVKNKDKWSALSMKERADLIKLYVSNGITSLDTIKKDYNSFAPGGPIETDEFGYPADITPAIVTQDSEFNKFLLTLPDNQRLTPEEDYHTYQYWKINGRPKDFSEALNLGMYHYDSSDNSYHANSVAFDSKGVGHFMKPKHHPTVKYELDWYNKGIGTLEGGKQYPLQEEERKEWEDFRSQYQLDSTGVNYKYVPRKHHNSFGGGGDTENNQPVISEELDPSVVVDYSNLKQEAKDARDWVLDYYKSEGYKNRAREAGLTARFPLERHLGIFPKKKLRFEEDWSVDSSYNWLYPVIGLQESENPFTNNHADEVGFTTAHEFAHDSKLFNTPAKSYEDTYRSPYYNNSYKKLPKEYIGALEVRQLVDPHDMEFSESYSDLIGLRYLLDKYNIFDSKDSNSVFDSEMYNNLIQDERFKNNRFLKLHEEKQVIDAINNVAQNTTSSNRLDYVNPENIVAFGGKINRFEGGGNKSNTNQTLFSPENPYMWEGFNVVEEEPTLALPVHNYWESKVLSLPQEEVERAYGFHRNVMVPEEMPTTEELQKMLDSEIVFSDFREDINDWKDKLADDDLTSLYKLIDRDSEKFAYKVDDLYNYNDYKFSDFDDNDFTKITAPNTDISKFIFGNKVSNKALAEVARVSKLRGQDPYDVLAHMLIEASGSYIDMNEYFNTHDLFVKQINPNLLGIYSDEEQILKQLGIYNKDRKPTIKQVKKAFEKLQAKREEALNKIVIPESNIDAVALRMMLHGRDFNPAQKGFTHRWTNGTVKNSYLDMIDSAIASLKENMPDLFK